MFPDPAYTLGEWIEIVENGNRITITGEYGCAFDGVVGPTAAAGTIGGTLKIFSGDGAVAWGQAKFGYLKVYNNSQTTLKLDLVPYRIGTAPYLYDKVSGTFFAKIGTDDMVCGGDV